MVGKGKEIPALLFGSKIVTVFYINDISITRNRNFLNKIKTIYEKTTANIILSDEKKRVFPLRLEIRQGFPL